MSNSKRRATAPHYRYPPVQHIAKNRTRAVCGARIPLLEDIPADWFEVMGKRPFCGTCVKRES